MADVAHELRTPLAVLRGNLESLQAGVIKPDTGVISSLHDEIIRISRLVYELQEISLAEAGKLELNLAEENIRELLHKTANYFQAELSARGIKLELNLPDNLTEVKIDRDRISQVIINLIDNALKYTSTGGTVRMEAASEGDQLSVAIIDNGSGINEKDLPHVFERFYRSEKERSREHGSSGLGLAIAKSFVEAHGGRIRAFNNTASAGGGCTFVFTLPVG